MLEQENASKNIKEFYCISCDYRCSKKGDFTRHLDTRKHKIRTGQEQQKTSKNIFKCECGKVYKSRSAHWSHKKKCDFISIENYKNEKEEKLEKENSELKEMLVEQSKQLQKVLEVMPNIAAGTTNNITNNTTNNNQFNLNIFLNEKCKDALNLEDFIDNLKLQLEDLDRVGKYGYVEGISNVIIRGLEELDEDKRPIHCTDVKREVLYVKDQGEWGKDEDKSKIATAVRNLSDRNMKNMTAWVKENPNKQDEFHKIIPNLNDPDQQPKNIKNVIKKVAQASMIDKKIE